MQLVMNNRIKNFDYKNVENVLLNENKFIKDLFAILPIPVSAQRRVNDDNDDDDDDDDEQNEEIQVKDAQIKPASSTTRAKSLQELQERLDAIKSKRKLTYKDKLVKQGLKNRMKKKTKRDERNAQKKLLRAQKADKNSNKPEKTNEETDNQIEEQPKKPVFNADNKMVFSKFDFSNIGKNKEKKQTSDPKKLLKNLQEQNEKLNKLEASGEKAKVTEIKEKTLWKNALAKSEGKKVKDDVTLLKKSVKRKEQQKKSSKKKWDKRIEGVKKAQEERQKKRAENIAKRKKEKKTNKLKKAVKKGKIVPGF